MAPDMTDVFIIRHGNTFDAGDVVTRVGARTDLPLSRSGRAQADLLADYFATEVPQGFAQAYCSALIRTRQTADMVLQRYDEAPELAVLGFLREIDYGPDENQPETAVIARIGTQALCDWDTSAIPPPGWEIEPDAIIQHWENLFKMLAESDTGGKPVLIVTSNGIARFALAAADTSTTKQGEIKLKTGAFGRFSLKPGSRARVEKWNIQPQL